LRTNQSASEASVAVDKSGAKPPFVSPLELLTPSDRGTRRPAVSDSVPWRELHHPEQPTGAEVGLPADVEGDLARILARALVQQFRADVASTVSSSAAAAADPRQATPWANEEPIRDRRTSLARNRPGQNRRAMVGSPTGFDHSGRKSLT
jgi:hypothetical protein